MNNKNWTKTATLLPKQGQLVETISEGGISHKLKLHGKLWFVEDGSTFVYYTPTMWREL